MKRNKGFTLIELLIAMVMFVFVIVAASQVFTSILTQFKQQSKIAETDMEGILGLEILRRDIMHAGLGLPWFAMDTGGNMQTFSYSEAANPPENAYNDASSNAPRGVFSNNEDSDSDRLIIKASNVAVSNTSQRWTLLESDDTKRADMSGYNFESTDRIIVLVPGADESKRRSLLLDYDNSYAFSTTYNATSAYTPGFNESFNVIYGIDPDTDLRMPFNRADYYISTSSVPSRCAVGTGVLIKNVLQQSDGAIGAGLPLLDCVADFQVAFWLDTDGDGTIDAQEDDIDDALNIQLDAEEIREQVKQVRVYILVHEGQKDTNFTFTNFTCTDHGGICITVGDSGVGRNFDLSGITDYKNYRWKLYILAVSTENL